MSKKFTILVIPDDDSETSSYSFSKVFIKIAIIISLITVLLSIAVIVKTIPNISKFDKDFVYYQIIFNGTPNNFLKSMSHHDYTFDTQNKLWILK